ncbi:alpha/beta hydrolase [Pseudomonas resinovorans]|uniref:alpha/beta fold hydrolase n=1 Tax=Metapseudomonas resinovorans TaxID=53412 RepID=UPI00237FD10E|nr:alpha/beta hydrolase [Pseudomonas resinovorans]MDE3739054.1 alpha/beta hydrolase [Pseudomonas resinovorans]
MTTPQLETLSVNGIHMQVAMQGAGPLVLLCHGFPELWYSWRHQLDALSTAGFRVVAPDMRGYGGTDAPLQVEAYTRLHLIGDMVDLVRVLGERQAVIAGHDWGAMVAWGAALTRPDLFRAVIGMSVPFAPPDPTDVLKALEDRGIHDYYLQYFQVPGVAEAELERDTEATIRRLLHCGSGDWRGVPAFGRLPGQGFLDHMEDPRRLPTWLTEDDIAHYTGEFRRTGFRGGLNWYRTMRLSAELMAPWRGCIVRQPSLFIAGDRDSVLGFPMIPQLIAAFPKTLPGLRGCHMLEGAGHWIQQERATEVSRLMLEFLRTL